MNIFASQLQKQPIIRTLLSGLFLLLFAFSVTPRIFLHDWVARHQDRAGWTKGDGHDHLQRVSFHCQTEDQVVESPFLAAEASPQITPPIVFRPEWVERTVRLHTTRIIYSSLRGPPAFS